MQLPGWGDSDAVKDRDRQTSSEGLVFPNNRGSSSWSDLFRAAERGQPLLPHTAHSGLSELRGAGALTRGHPATPALFLPAAYHPPMQGSEGKHTRAKPRPGPPSQRAHVTLLLGRPVSKDVKERPEGHRLAPSLMKPLVCPALGQALEGIEPSLETIYNP